MRFTVESAYLWWQLQHQARQDRWTAWCRERLAHEGECGQSTLEYALIIALVVIGAMGAVNAFGAGVAQVFSRVLAQIQGVG